MSSKVIIELPVDIFLMFEEWLKAHKEDIAEGIDDLTALYELYYHVVGEEA